MVVFTTSSVCFVGISHQIMVQLDLNLITHAHYLASNITFLLSAWSETHILDQFACITVGIS